MIDVYHIAETTDLMPQNLRPDDPELDAVYDAAVKLLLTQEGLTPLTPQRRLNRSGTDQEAASIRGQCGEAGLYLYAVHAADLPAISLSLGACMVHSVYATRQVSAILDALMYRLCWENRRRWKLKMPGDIRHHARTGVKHHQNHAAFLMGEILTPETPHLAALHLNALSSFRDQTPLQPTPYSIIPAIREQMCVVIPLDTQHTDTGSTVINAHRSLGGAVPHASLLPSLKDYRGGCLWVDGTSIPDPCSACPHRYARQFGNRGCNPGVVARGMWSDDVCDLSAILDSFLPRYEDRRPETYDAFEIEYAANSASPQDIL